MKIQINKAAVQGKIMGAWEKNLAALTIEIREDCNEFVKRSPNHTMRDSSLTNTEPGLIAWVTPYAKRQYWEIQTALTPGTTWRWIETAKRAYLKRWQRKAQEGIDRNL